MLLHICTERCMCILRHMSCCTCGSFSFILKCRIEHGVLLVVFLILTRCVVAFAMCDLYLILKVNFNCDMHDSSRVEFSEHGTRSVNLRKGTIRHILTIAIVM